MKKVYQVERAKKAVILARVSSKEQEEGYSLDGQENNARAYCQRKGLEVLETFSFSESSTKGTRKKFHVMLDFIDKQEECIAIVSDTVDRFQRSFKETLELNPKLNAGKVELHFVSNGLVLHKNSPASDKTMWNMCVLMAESYVLQLSDNTKRGIHQKIKDGEWPGKAPLGYKNIMNEHGKRIIVIDPETAPLIKKLFEMYATGNHTLRGLTQWLVDEGFKGRRGSKYFLSTIDRTLKNPFYYGMMKVRGEIRPHIHGSLIDKHLFDMCQNVRNGYHQQHTHYGSKEFVFRSVIKCADCGTLISPYTKARKTKNGVHYHTYLMCSHYKAKKDGFACTAEQINEKDALQQTQAALEKIKVAPEVLKVALDELQSSTFNDLEYLRNKEIAAKKRLGSIDSERKSLFAKEAAGLIDESFLTDRLKELKTEEDQLKREAQNHTEDKVKQAYTAERVLNLVNRLPELFKNGSKVEQKRAILKLVLSNVELKGKNLYFFYEKPFGLLSEGLSCSKWYRGRDLNP
ncbi:MAG: recombinase family protein [Spirochaetes bacterium]|nr:recombinase family protein [Spirochaetota bacterium]